MKRAEIKEIAQRCSIKVGKLNKSELVRAIQRAEGNEPCFESGKMGNCGQHNCSWRAICS